MAQSARERMIRSALVLFAERGVQGTSFADVIAHSGAPRGSIYHHFPGGKEALVRAVLDTMRQAGPGALAALEGREGRGVIDGFIDGWARILTSTDYVAGCSVLGITVTTEDSEVRAAAGDVFSAWVEQLEDLLVAGGVPSAQARPVAWTLLSAAEGAVAVCRSQRSLEPLEAVRQQLRQLVAP
ncbi:TetR/AcrR family transcriptional regulator [Rudaeicoccus suwonensis]|uniref:TetR family transcriptional regulator n=1 Tax=Rudaeicoccus suwonensis TaxID=657409 RepID=A0A561E3A9_9MICO|nr:TetR/AcrR family transcriptional regulator [Rudaeicoccus suwonensis]TWE10094.1 TetR family transcriptional regulator [Rudaeicoccus suwonensis]